MIVRQSFWTTLIKFSGVALGYINLLWLFPAFLQTEEIGLLRVLFSFSSFVAALVPLGSQKATIRFYPYYERLPEKQDFFSSLLLITFFGYLIFFLFFFFGEGVIVSFFEDNSPLFLHYVEWGLPFVFLLAYFRVFDHFSRSILHVTFPNFLRDILIRLFIAFLVPLYAWGFIEQGSLVAIYALLFIIPVIVLVIFLDRKGIRPFLGDPFKLRAQGAIRPILSFGVFAMLTNLGAIMVKNVDMLMISGLLGLEEAGIYSIAFYIGLVSEIPRRSIAQTTTPVLSRAFKKAEWEKIAFLYKNTALHYTLAGGLILIGIWASVDDLFRVIPNGERFAEGKFVILAIGLGKMTDMIAGINGKIIMISRKYRVNLWFTLTLAVLVVVLNYIFINLFGLLGAAIASALSLALFNLLKTVYVYWKFKLHPFSWKILKLFLILCLSYFIGLLIEDLGHPLINIGTRSFLILIVFFPLIYFLKISKEINDLIHKTLKKWPLSRR